MTVSTSSDDVAGVVLAAGAGSRLRPLTVLRPKPLCPVGDRPMLDHAIERFTGSTGALAVNVHHRHEQLVAHLDGRRDRVHVSHEVDRALGTAGALGQLRPWIDGRPTVVVNGDTWCPAPVARLLDGWDGDVVRILSPDAGPLGPRTRIAGALLPWADVEGLAAEPSGLYELCWADAALAGRLEVVTLADGVPFVDCATVFDYLAANLQWSGGGSVVGLGAEVEGTVERSVVWPGSVVGPTEHLVDAVRAGPRTVYCRPRRPGSTGSAALRPGADEGPTG